MVGIFSLAYWPLTHLIWRNVYLNNQIIPYCYNFVVENLSEVHQSTFTLNQCIAVTFWTLSVCWCWMCWALRMPSKPQGFFCLLFPSSFPKGCSGNRLQKAWSSGTYLCSSLRMRCIRVSLSTLESFGLGKGGIKAQCHLLHWGVFTYADLPPCAGLQRTYQCFI